MTAITIDRPSFRGSLEFAVADDVLKFLERESDLWQWTNEPSIPDNAAVALGHYRGEWKTVLVTAANNWKADPDNQTVQDALMVQLKKRYQSRNAWCANEPETWEIHELAKDDPVAAAVAMAVLNGQEHQIEAGLYGQRLEYRRGRAKGYAILAGLDPKLLDGVSASAEQIKSGMQKDANDLRSVLSESKSASDAIFRKINDEASSGQNQLEQEYIAAHQLRREEFDGLKKSLENTNEFYSKQMEVQGAVRYWRLRGQQHRRSAFTALACLVVFTVASIWALFYVYSQAGERLPATLSATDPMPLAALFKAAAFGILMTTVLFWIGRVILRLYLSERHLATDAEERRTMVMTYLALTRTKKLSDEDKKLIFPAIFRSGADGIVKEENSPDTAFAALVASIMKR